MMGTVRMRKNRFLSRRWPYIVVCCIILLAEFSSSILRARGGSETVILMGALIYFFFSLALAIFIFVTTWRIFTYLQRNADTIPKTSSNRLLFITYNLFASGVSVLSLCALSLFVASRLYGTTRGFYTIWWFIFFVLGLASFFQIRCFTMKAVKTVSASTDEDSKNYPMSDAWNCNHNIFYHVIMCSLKYSCNNKLDGCHSPLFTYLKGRSSPLFQCKFYMHLVALMKWY